MSLTEMSSVALNEKGKLPKYICVDYPANVVNVDKMVATLGGHKMISQVYNEPNRRLELRFRPDDIYCKPVCGDRNASTSLLVKLKRRVKKVKKTGESNCDNLPSKNDPPVIIESTLIGAVNTTYAFNTMCDAQYLPVITDSTTGEIEDIPYHCFAMQKFEDSTWLQQEPQPLFLHPAAFSRMDVPQAYFYRSDGSDSFIPQESKSSQAQKKSTEEATSSQPSNSQSKDRPNTVTIDINSPTTQSPYVICGTRRKRTLFALFRGFADPTPNEPQPQALKQLNIKFSQAPVKPVYEKLKALFNSRPIWSKNALRVILGDGSENLKFFLPTIAYYFKDGPWRNVWVKFGYDPRKEPQSCMYQTFDYRLKQTGKLKSLIEAKRNYSNYILPYKNSAVSKKKISVIQANQLQEAMDKYERKKEGGEDSEEETVKPSEGVKDDIYIFKPGTIPPHRQMFYQYIDLHVDEIVEVLKESMARSTESLKCDPSYGWLTKEVEEECRRIINSLVDEAADKRIREQVTQEDSTSV